MGLARDVLQARACGALAVMAVDAKARADLFFLDPGLELFLVALHEHFPEVGTTKAALIPF